MYSFQSNAAGRKSRQTIRLMSIVIFVLIIALAGVTFSYVRSRSFSDSVSASLVARATSEAGSAQSAVYRLTQSSGSNTAALLATVRAHIYAIQCLNTLAANIYGPSTTIVDGELPANCIAILDACETRLQAGSVITDLYTDLRDGVDRIVAAFNGSI